MHLEKYAFFILNAYLVPPNLGYIRFNSVIDYNFNHEKIYLQNNSVATFNFGFGN